MSTAATVGEPLFTAEQFAGRPDPGHPEELVRGRVVALSFATPRHGEICGRASRIFGALAYEYDLGHVLTNNPGVIPRRGPDTVRGPDVCFYGFKRVPRGPPPEHYLEIVPELVIEVLSPPERWAN